MAEPQWSEESFYKKELSKWNRQKRDGGMAPDGFMKFPQMLYRAQQNPLSGKHEVSLARDVISADKTVVILSAEQFNSSCQLIVNSEHEYVRARAEGWRDSQPEAMAFHEGLQDDIARAAAQRSHADRNMSEKARAEVKTVEDGTAAQVPEIPQKPVDRMAKARAAKAARKAASVA